MKEQAFFDFLIDALQKGELDYTQYSFRPEATHIGGVAIGEEELPMYTPDAIPGLTTMEQAWELDPIKLSYEIDNDVHIVYELSGTSEFDWIRNAKMIQIGLDYKGVTFKLYEFVFGYEHGTYYSDADKVETYKKAAESNHIHCYFGGCVNIYMILSALDFKTNFTYDENVYIRANSIVVHDQRANPMNIIDLFISNSTLHVTPMFERVMKFGETVSNKMPISSKDIKKVVFHIPYSLEKYFSLPNDIKDVEIKFTNHSDHPAFFNDNKELLLGASGLELDSKVYNALKTEQLNEFATKYCIITYEDENKKGVVLSNMMAHKLLVDEIRQQKKEIVIGTGKSSKRYKAKEFIKRLKVTEINAEVMKMLLQAQGKKIGHVKWYRDELEGSLFKVREASADEVRS
ncbi:MAG: hypothetical protein P8J32_06795 [bacterium]|nr:hypothetical protein [bacterium]